MPVNLSWLWREAPAPLHWVSQEAVGVSSGETAGVPENKGVRSESRSCGPAMGQPQKSHTPVTSAALHCEDIGYPDPTWEKTILQCERQEGRVKQTTLEAATAGGGAI